MGSLLAAGISAGGGAGCVTAESSGVRLDVPFVAQPASLCGVAALEMVLAYYGVAADQHPDARQTYFATLGGSPIVMLAHVARQAGVDAEVRSAEPERLEEWLGEGIPVIALWQAPEQDVGHYVVVTGFDPEQGKIRIHSARSAGQRLSRRAFEDRWAGSGYSAVLIKPRSQPPSGQ